MVKPNQNIIKNVPADQNSSVEFLNTNVMKSVISSKFKFKFNCINHESIHNGNLRTTLSVYQQNICGLRYKTDELVLLLGDNLPQVFCFSDHHLKNFELVSVFQIIH
jgi:hypothetical protein